MRGHICDMDHLMKICDQAGVRVIEDCAHTMGAKWRETWSGRHGVVGCYSTQTYKHINSGEGGFLVTDDADVMAKAVILSGSYMLYKRHIAAPAASHYADIRYHTPNVSGRMDHLRAAILRPQLANLHAQARALNMRYPAAEEAAAHPPGLQPISRPKEAS